VTGTLPPSNEQVAVKWLQGIPALGGLVATVLPSALSDWAETGFVTVGGAGGTPHMYLPIARPVVSVHFWAVTVSGSRPPWGAAHDLYSHVRHDDYGVLDYDNIGRALTGFPAKYTNARAQTVNFLGEPERRPGDPGDFAEYVANLEIQWVPIP
jgi:hypothetical protein